LSQARYVAEAFGAKITLLHVMPSSPSPREASRTDALEWEIAKRETAQYLAHTRESLGPVPCEVVTELTQGAPAEQIVAKHGRIDLLVNSAGINVPKRSWADMELEGWDKLVEINLNGVLYCMRAVLPAMRKQKDGCIINVASWAGRHVSKMPGPAYTTTKHAVLALTHSFNMDECVNGLRACCLSPGEVATPILKLRPVVPSEAEQARMLQPEDCGRTIAFVASMPPRVCMNEILISPTWNRGFVQTPNNRD